MKYLFAVYIDTHNVIFVIIYFRHIMYRLESIEREGVRFIPMKMIRILKPEQTAQNGKFANN